MNTDSTNNDVKELSNIPQTGFKTQHEETVKEMRMVEFNKSGYFKLSAFSIEQLLLGFGNHTTNQIDAMFATTVLTKLTHLALIHDKNEDEGHSGIILLYAEVLLMRKWLVARMHHCESELNTYNEQMTAWTAKVNRRIEEEEVSRENAETYFYQTKPKTNYNPSTAVAQKNLLLEFKLWLCGDIID